jgi:hypothetical protein
MSPVRSLDVALVAAVWAALACSSPTAPAVAAAVDTAIDPGDAPLADAAETVADAPATVDADTDSAVAADPCPPFLAPAALGKIADKQLGELSGMVESRRNANVLWVHNDSGGGPLLYAINLAGKRLATVTLLGATNVDWEDLAATATGTTGQPDLYVGDIGDNNSSRSTIAVYRLVEPVVDAGLSNASTEVSDFTKFIFAYPDGAHDAEALLIDPPTGDLYVVTKATDGKSKVYRAAAPLQASEVPVLLAKVGKLQFGQGALPGDMQVTAGEVSSDGRLVGLRTRTAAFAWRRPEGEELQLALLAAPCVLPIHAEDQGESLAWAVDGGGFYTLSEGVGAKIFFAKRK